MGRGSYPSSVAPPTTTDYTPSFTVVNESNLYCRLPFAKHFQRGWFADVLWTVHRCKADFLHDVTPRFFIGLFTAAVFSRLDCLSYVTILGHSN